MKRKEIQRRRRELQNQWAELDALEQIQWKHVPAAPPTNPPPPPPVAVATAQGPRQQLWRFEHTHPQIAGTCYTVVMAPSLQEARGAAYLLAEAFTQNVIGFLKANHPPHLPNRPAA